MERSRFHVLFAASGGHVDGRAWAGEYNLHRKRVNSAGTVTRNEPIDENNDAIKAINYGCYYYYGARGDRYRADRYPRSVPYRMSF